MPRDSKDERQLKLAVVRDRELPTFQLVGGPKPPAWRVYRCGRAECGRLFSLRVADTELALKSCPHCFMSGKLPPKGE